MPSVSGNLSYASGRYGGISGLTGIPNIPIVIQDTTSGVGVAVLTDAAGNFVINAVPNGTYRIVEAYGYPGGVASPATFTNATIPEPTPKDPPLSAIAAPIAGTNTVDSLSPNTLLLTVTTTIINRMFRDSSVKVNPLTLPNGSTIQNNILTYAGNGIWGTLPAGTLVNRMPATYPYTNSMVSSLLAYVNFVPPNFNQFTMININTLTWFCASNHTTFDETSSCLFVNGGDPKALLFQQTVNVTPNTFYLASAWLMMVTNIPDTCLIGFKVLGQDGVTELFYGQTSNIAYGQWGQIGQVFSTKNNSQVTVQVLSMSDVAGGNDFLLDDVQLQLASFDGNVTFNKYVDKSIVTVGSTINYTSVVTTNFNLFDIRFQDTIPFGTTFNPGTVKVNGTTYGSFNPITGFTLPAMSIGSASTITFNVTVTTTPTSNMLNNVSNFTYSVAPIPGNTITNTIFSDTVSTAVQHSKLSSVKLANKSNLTVGASLSYTITITNTGNVSAGNVVFKDTIPNGTTFVNDSLYVNGVQLPGVSPSSPISLGTMPAGRVATINFGVVVYTIPSPNPIPNSSITTYMYLVDPTIGFYPTDTSMSNTAYTRVNLAIIGSSKTVDKLYADTGTTLTYTIALKNLGSATANNVLFIDTIPSGVSYVANSLKQDGVTVTGSSNPPGVTLPNVIGIGKISTITFKVVTITIPSPNPIPNSAAAVFNYFIDASTPNGGAGNTNANTVYTQVNNATVAMTKTSDLSFVDVGTTITYTILVNNSGNVSAVNVLFKDTIPSGTTFVNGSFSVNGATLAGSPNPPGINLGTIPVGITTVTFKVIVATLPTINPIPNSATATYNYTMDPSIPNGGSGSSNSNINNVSVNNASVAMTKTSNLSYADIGSPIIYTVLIRNTGNASITNVLFSDTISNGTTFVNGSFSINGTTIPGSPNPPGINLGTIPVGLTTVTFKVLVNTMPSPNPIPNIAGVAYNYTIDPSFPNGASGSSNSNIVYTKVNHGQIVSSKTVDKSYVTCSDILKYTVVITNTGNVPTSNIVFQDTIPNGTQFISNSFTVNGVTIIGANPSVGVSLATIPGGATSTLTFQVTVMC